MDTVQAGIVQMQKNPSKVPYWENGEQSYWYHGEQSMMYVLPYICELWFMVGNENVHDYFQVLYRYLHYQGISSQILLDHPNHLAIVWM